MVANVTPLPTGGDSAEDESASAPRNPIEGEPADVNAITADYAYWLGTSNIPKLFFKAEPGAILTNDRLFNLVRNWPALIEKTVAGVHFVQEDSPDDIGKAIADWMASLV